jgi:hypothetical protein
VSNNEYREAQQQAREHGLKARHEQRLENATYTAAEVKVLTVEARQQAAEEIARGLEALQDPDGNSRGLHLGLRMGAQLARNIGSDDAVRDRWLNLDRLDAIKWGSTIIDASEVVYILRSPNG